MIAITGFDVYFVTYAWPIPQLLVEDKAIKHFCPFGENKEPPQHPVNDHQLYNMLRDIKHCPCAKKECYDWMAKLLIMDQQHRLLRVLADKIKDCMYDDDE